MTLLESGYCANCGAVRAPGARYCATCGRPVSTLDRRVRSGTSVLLGGQERELAGIGSRLGALIVDAIVAMIASLPLLFFYNPWTAFRWETNGTLIGPDYSMFDVLIGSTYGLVYSWIWESLGWSPGKAMVGIRIRRSDGHRLGPAHGLARATIKSLAGSFAIGYLWATWDDQRQTLHDKAADTYVIKHVADTEGAPGEPAPTMVEPKVLWWGLGGAIVWFLFQVFYLQTLNAWFDWLNEFETEFERDRPMVTAPFHPDLTEATRELRDLAYPSVDVFSSSSTQFPSGSSTIAIRSPGRTSSGPEGTA